MTVLHFYSVKELINSLTKVIGVISRGIDYDFLYDIKLSDDIKKNKKIKTGANQE